MYVGLFVAAVVGIKVAEKIIGQKIAGVIADFGHKFLANFRSIRPFIFPEQRQAKKVVCVRCAGIKGYSPLELTDRIVLHFGVAISVAEEHMKRAGIAH